MVPGLFTRLCITSILRLYAVLHEFLGFLPQNPRLTYIYRPYETVFQSISGRLPERGRKKREMIDISVYIGQSPREREKEERNDR